MFLNSIMNPVKFLKKPTCERDGEFAVVSVVRVADGELAAAHPDIAGLDVDGLDAVVETERAVDGERSDLESVCVERHGPLAWN